MGACPIATVPREMDPSLVRPRLLPAVVPGTILANLPPRPHTGSGPGGIGRGRGDIDGLVHVLREDMRRQIDDGVGTERLCKEVGGEIRRRLIRGRTRCGRPRQLGFFFVFYFHETLRKYEWKN